jgi:hypothetical protein
MNRYACDECGAYLSSEDNAAKARRVHRFAHLVIDSDPQLQRLEVPVNQLRDYVQKRIGNIVAQRHRGH